MKKHRWIEVQVTQTMIDRARPSDCAVCLIAVALRAATGLSWNVWYNDAKIDGLWGRKPTWKLPRAVRDLRERFDAGEKVEPTSFRLPARFADRERYDWSCQDEPQTINPYIVKGLLAA